MDNKDNKPKRINDFEREGVYYTPSHKGYRIVDEKDEYEEKQSVRIRKTSQTNDRKQKSQKSQYAVFFVATLFTGIIICIIIFTIVFKTFSSKNSTTTLPIETEITSIQTEDAQALSEKTTTVTGVIKTLDASDRGVTVYNADLNNFYNLRVEADSVLKNKYGQTIVFAELMLGDIVDVDFISLGSKIKSLTLSAWGFEYKHVSNVNINDISRIITIGNDEYKYNENIIVQKNGENYSIEKIKPIDIITVKGYNQQAAFIDVTKSHGYIEFINKDIIKDGRLEIDTTIFRSLDETDTLELLEGSHRVVIKAANITPFTEDIIVNHGETLTIDLIDVQPLSGVLNLRVNQTDYSVIIDGNIIDLSEPIMLEYGEHSIKVDKNGFLPWEGTVLINSPAKDFPVEIEEEIKMSRIIINTSPEGADVYIDNAKIEGKTPLTTNVEYGNHRLVVKLPGYFDSPTNIDANQPLIEYAIELMKDPSYIPPGTYTNETNSPITNSSPPQNTEIIETNGIPQ